MKKLRILLIALLGLAASSATSQEVRFNFDESADFVKFKTYKWVTIEGVVQAEGPTKEQIEAAFDSELAKKGLAKVDNDSADLFVAYQFGIHSDQHLSSFANVEYTLGLPFGGTMPEGDIIIHKGELALDIVCNLQTHKGMARCSHQNCQPRCKTQGSSEAFLWLNKAYDAHGLLFVKASPEFDSLRNDPRYSDLLRRMGLPQ